MTSTTPPAAAPADAARAESLTKVYGSGETKVVALDAVSVSFPAGQFTAIMGPSGSGKSTLMHCLAGLDEATDGAVFIGDVDITKLDDKKLTRLRRDAVGFIFQAFNLLPTLNAIENITLPMDIAGRKPDQQWLDTVIDTIGLRDRLKHRPTELSGGQQQRVACARALASRPEIIFADEPTGNLDSASGAELLGFLRRSTTEMGQTIVMVTHDPGAASYADRVLFLADGRIVDEMAAPTAATSSGPDEEVREGHRGGRRPMIRATFKSLAARKLRLVLSSLSIVLGVSFVAGAFVLTDSLGKVFDNLFSTVNQHVAVDVRGDKVTSGDQGDVRALLPAGLVDTVRNVDGVKEAQGQVAGSAQLVNKAGQGRRHRRRSHVRLQLVRLEAPELRPDHPGPGTDGARRDCHQRGPRRPVGLQGRRHGARAHRRAVEDVHDRRHRDLRREEVFRR